MKEIPQVYETPTEQRLFLEGFRFNRFGELSMPADEFIRRWENQRPMTDALSRSDWWVRSLK